MFTAFVTAAALIGIHPNTGPAPPFQSSAASILASPELGFRRNRSACCHPCLAGIIVAWLELFTKINTLNSHVQIERDAVDALQLIRMIKDDHLPMRQYSDVEPLVTDTGQLIPSGEGFGLV